MPLPLSDISHVQTVRLRGTGGEGEGRRGGVHVRRMPIRSVRVHVRVRAFLHMTVVLCTRPGSHLPCAPPRRLRRFHSPVNRKLSATRICPTCDNSRPGRPLPSPPPPSLDTDLQTGSCRCDSRRGLVTTGTIACGAGILLLFYFFMKA